jgi:outer membrane receptor protein involved in Fe transport
LQLDKNNPIPLYYDLNGEPIFGGVVDYPRLYDGASQALFDYNLRNELGLPTNGTDWIDLNSYAPSTFSINMFSPDELLNNGSSFVSYYGYDYTGEKLSSQPTLDDFFNQIRTVDGYNGPNVYSRNIGAYEPNYVAGYIQDKFAFKDLIFNIGLRIDRFDANQKKLKDPYLLFPAITAGEVRAGGDRGNLNESIPTNIGDDYVVYVDNLENPGQVVGYRNGDKWYNNEGAELANSSSLLTSTGIQPYLQDPDKTEATQISSEAFEDYEPQTTFMPRIAFSFPISDEAMFFAHYDVLSRRPSGATRFNPTQYLFMQNVNDIINNPNLKPSSTVDYELGFQQKLNNFSSLKISVFYKEERDMVQVTKVVDAYPITYTTYGNLDFSTIKGMTVAYDLRRMGNVRLRASYTLQFADGTGSSTQQALAVISAGFPNLKTINALNWDQRHAISTSFDYHYGKGKDYDGPVISFKDKNIKLLEEAGANIVIIGGSGVPYSKQRNITKEGGFASEAAVLDGTLNGSRLPWQVNMDAKLDKYFDLEWGRENKKRASLNVYLQVLNVLNTLNVTGVYGATGNPDDDGYLNDPGAQQGIISLNDEQAFRELYTLKVNNPGNFSLPRQIRLGLMLNF